LSLREGLDKRMSLMPDTGNARICALSSAPAAPGLGEASPLGNPSRCWGGSEPLPGARFLPRSLLCRAGPAWCMDSMKPHKSALCPRIPLVPDTRASFSVHVPGISLFSKRLQGGAGSRW